MVFRDDWYYKRNPILPHERPARPSAFGPSTKAEIDDEREGEGGGEGQNRGMGSRERNRTKEEERKCCWGLLSIVGRDGDRGVNRSIRSLRLRPGN